MALYFLIYPLPYWNIFFVGDRPKSSLAEIFFCNSATPSYIGKPANEVTLQSWAAFNSLEASILTFSQPLCLFADRSVCFVMSYVRILGGTAAVSGGLYAYYRFRDSGQQVCKLHKLYICLYVSFLVSCSLAVFFASNFMGH